MGAIRRALLLFLFAAGAMAQTSEPPLSDSRLTIHTLIREDIFAGLLSNDMERFSRGERNIQLLLQQRPAEKAALLAWQAAASVYRAVRAQENSRSEEFQQKYQQALDLLSEANRLAPDNIGVAAVTGGTYAVLADRLPEKPRAAAWERSYDAYKVMWKQQAPIVEKLPLHIKGELLAGLAQAAQRTGRNEEASQYVDKILELLPDTPYENVGKQWRKNPQVAAKTTITCLSCHEPGRLAAKMTALPK